MQDSQKLFSEPNFLYWDVQKDYPFFFKPDDAGFLPCEMSGFDNAFLLGLIKKVQPRKILEVGVAAGATTTMILDYISKTPGDVELWSVDLNEQYYRVPEKLTGYLALERFTNFPRWHFLKGDVLPAFMPAIAGGGVDFCILDTVHALPGELLDYLVVLTKMDVGSIIVLHDTALPLRLVKSYEYAKHCYSTKVVFDTAVGNKIVCKDTTHNILLPNISALQITEDTFKYIANSFFALGMPWFYIPEDKMLDVYREYFTTYYSSSCIEYFDTAIMAQKIHRDELIQAFQGQAEPQNQPQHEPENKRLQKFIGEILRKGMAFLRH